jgi:hypothetical protein
MAHRRAYDQGKFRTGGVSMAEETKGCPFCGEEILQVAIKCKHCGSMLDGSGQEKKVTVTGVDPFAELHTPIKGKVKGKLTFIGKLGIGLGILIMAMGFITMVSAGADFEMQNSFLIVLVGVGFSVASFLWARRPAKK